MLNKVTVTVLATSRLTVDESGIPTAVVDGTSYREQLTRAQQLKSADLVLPWSRYYNWLWAYQLGPEYPNVSPKLMVEMLVPLVVPLEVSVDSPHVERVDAELVWHPFAVTTVAHLRLRGDSWHDDQLATVLDEVLRSCWGGIATQVRNGLPVPAISLSWDHDASSRPSSLKAVSTAIVISGLHHGDSAPGPLAYSLASLFERSSTDKSFTMHIDGSHLAVTDRRVGIVLPNTLRNAERRQHCLHANMTTLLALIENLRTLHGGTGQYAEWYGYKADAVLRSLYQRTDHPSVGSVYKSRLAQVWIDHRSGGRRPYADPGQ